MVLNDISSLMCVVWLYDLNYEWLATHLHCSLLEVVLVNSEKRILSVALSPSYQKERRRYVTSKSGRRAAPIVKYTAKNKDRIFIITL